MLCAVLRMVGEFHRRYELQVNSAETTMPVIFMIELVMALVGEW